MMLSVVPKTPESRIPASGEGRAIVLFFEGLVVRKLATPLAGTRRPHLLAGAREHRPGTGTLRSAGLEEAFGDMRTGPRGRLRLCAAVVAFPASFTVGRVSQDPRSPALRSYHLRGVFLRMRVLCLGYCPDNESLISVRIASMTHGSRSFPTRTHFGNGHYSSSSLTRWGNKAALCHCIVTGPAWAPHNEQSGPFLRHAGRAGSVHSGSTVPGHPRRLKGPLSAGPQRRPGSVSASPRPRELGAAAPGREAPSAWLLAGGQAGGGQSREGVSRGARGSAEADSPCAAGEVGPEAHPTFMRT